MKIKKNCKLYFTDTVIKRVKDLAQPALKCLKLTIETLEQGVKIGVALVSLLLTLSIFYILF